MSYDKNTILLKAGERLSDASELKITDPIRKFTGMKNGEGPTEFLKANFEQLFKNNEYLKNASNNNFSLRFVRPDEHSTKTLFDNGFSNIAVIDPIKDMNYARSKSGGAYGIARQGDQYVFLKLNVLHNNVQNTDLSYEIKEIVNTVKIPELAMNVKNADYVPGITRAKNGSKRIFSKIRTKNINNRNMYSDADYKEIFFNVAAASINRNQGNIFEETENISNLDRNIASNLMPVDSVASISFFDSNTRIANIGLAQNAKTSSDFKRLVYDDPMLHSILQNYNIVKEGTTNIGTNTEEKTNKIMTYFDIDDFKKRNLKRIFSEIIEENPNLLVAKKSAKEQKTIFHMDDFLNAYTKKVHNKHNDIENYYRINSDTNVVNLIFTDPKYNINFDASEYFMDNKIFQSKLNENHLIKKVELFKSLDSNAKVSLKQFNKYYADDEEMQELFKTDFSLHGTVSYPEFFNKVSNKEIHDKSQLQKAALLFKEGYEEKISASYGYGNRSKKRDIDYILSSKSSIGFLDEEVNNLDVSTLLSDQFNPLSSEADHRLFKEINFDKVTYRDLMGLYNDNKFNDAEKIKLQKIMNKKYSASKPSSLTYFKESGKYINILDEEISKENFVKTFGDQDTFQMEMLTKDKITYGDIVSYMKKTNDPKYDGAIESFSAMAKTKYYEKYKEIPSIGIFDEGLIFNDNIHKEAKSHMKFSSGYLFGMLDTKEEIDSSIFVAKQQANTRGKSLNVSQSFIDILGAQNIAGQRHAQGGDKFSGLILNTGNGTLDFAKAVNEWETFNPENQVKVVNTNYESVKPIMNNLYKISGKGDEDFSLNLFSKYGTTLYTETDLAFQDSDVVDAITAMKSISQYDSKQIIIPFDAIKPNKIEEIVGKSGHDAYNEFYKNLKEFKELQNTENRFDYLKNQDSFGYKLVSNLLGEENFNKFKQARIDENGNFKNIADEFSSIGEDIKKIGTVQSKDDKLKLGLAIDNAVIKYNEFIDKYLVRSNADGNATTAVNKDFLKTGIKTSISSSNALFLEGIQVTDRGLVLKNKGVLLASDGSKLMNNNIKSTIQQTYNSLYVSHNGYSSAINNIVNEKMSKSKRGFNGTFYGRSIMTMAIHGLSQSIVDGDIQKTEENFNKFKENLKFASEIDLNNGKGKTNVLDLLGVDFSYSNGQLKIGEKVISDKEFLSTLSGGEDPLITAQSLLIDSISKRIENVLGTQLKDDEAEIFGNLITEKLYGAYDKFLDTLPKNKKEASRIFIEDGAIEKVGIHVIDNKKTASLDKVHNISKNGAFKFFTFTHMMKETKARKTSNAIKMGRLSNIIMTEADLGYVGIELQNSMMMASESKIVSDLSLLPSNMYASTSSKIPLDRKKVADVLFKKANGHEFYFSDFKDMKINTQGSASEFLRSNPIGKAIDALFDYDSNSLKDEVLGKISGLDDNFIAEAKKMTDFIQNPNKMSKVISDYYLEKSFNTIAGTSELEKSEKMKIFNFLNETVTDLFETTDFYTELSQKKSINGRNIGQEILNKFIKYGKTNEIENFEEKKNIIEKFLVNNKNKKKMNKINSTTQALLNQFIANPFNENFASGNYKLDIDDVRVMKNIFSKNGLPSFTAHYLNSIAGNDYTKVRILDGILDDGEVKFKIANFGIEKAGNMAYNVEVNRIANVVNSMIDVNELIEKRNSIYDKKYHKLGINKEDLNKIKASLNGIIEKDKNPEIVKLLNTENIGNSLFAINTDEEIENFNSTKMILKKMQRFAGVKGNKYTKEQKLKDIKKLNKALGNLSSTYNGKVNLEEMVNYSEQIKNFYTENDFEKLRKSLKLINIDKFKNGLMTKKMLNEEFSTVGDFINLYKIATIDGEDGKKALKLVESGEIASSYFQENGLFSFVKGKADQIDYSYIINILNDKDGNLNLEKKLSYSDAYNIYKSLNMNLIGKEVNIDSTSETVVLKSFLNNYESKFKNKTVNEFIDSYISGKELTIDNWIALNDRINNLTDSSINDNIKNASYVKLFKNLQDFGLRGDMVDKYNSLRIKNSATFSPAEGSVLTTFIKNKADKIIEFNKNKNLTKMASQERKDFKSAIDLIYGSHRTNSIMKFLENEDTQGMKDYLDQLSGIVIAERSEYDKLELGNLFTTTNSKGEKIVNNYAYGFTSRNPHQYVDSIRAARFVALDEKERELSFIGDYLGSSAKVKNKTPSFHLVGKRTALGMNADYDGDQLQLMKITGDDLLHVKNPKKMNKILDKIETDIKINLLLNDMTDYDLKNILSSDQATNPSLNNEFSKLYKLINKRMKLEGTKATVSPYEYIEDRFKTFRFRNIKIKNDYLDEAKDHAKLPAIQTEFELAQKTMTREKFSEFFLGLNQKQKSQILYQSLDAIDLDNLEELFTDLNPESKKKLETFNALTNIQKRESVYKLLSELAEESKNGALKFNNAWLSSTGYEAYTGIYKTGPVHTLLTNFREFNSAVKQGELFDLMYSDATKKYAKSARFNPAKMLKGIKELASTKGTYNTYSDLIEALSISSKHGKASEKQATLSQLEMAFEKYRRFQTEDKNYEFSDVFNISGIVKTIETLSENLTGNEIDIDGNNLNTLDDLTKVFFNEKTLKDEGVKDMYEYTKKAIGVLLEKGQDELKGDLNLTNNQRIALIDNVKLIINNAQGSIATRTANINNGFYKKLAKKDALGQVLHYADKNNKNHGIRFETITQSKFGRFIHKILKNITKSDVTVSSNGNILELDERNRQRSGVEAQIKEAVNKEINKQLEIEKAKEIEGKQVIEKSVISSNLSINPNDPAIKEVPIKGTIHTVNENVAEEVLETKDQTLPNIKSVTKSTNVAKDIQNEVIKNGKNASGEISGENYKNIINELKNNITSTENEKETLLKELNAVKSNLSEIQNKINNSTEIKNATFDGSVIEELKQQILDKENIIKELKQEITNKKNKGKWNKDVIELKKVIKALEQENKEMKKKFTEQKKLSEYYKKLSNDLNGVGSPEALNKGKKFLKQHKKKLAIAGGIAVIGTFVRMFQKSRSVVELDINDEQYERSKGSLYRELGNYNINTNIRTFH